MSPGASQQTATSSASLGTPGTRAWLENATLLNLGGRSSLLAQVDVAINNACEELTRYEWRELRERSSSLAMTANQQTVDMTTVTDLEELKRVIYLNGTLSYPLPIWTWEEAESRYAAADQQNNPTTDPVACYREGLLLYLVPVPSVTYNLRLFYRAKLTVGAAGTAAVSASGFDSLIVAWATAEVMESIEHGTKSAARWWAIYNSRLKQKMQSQRMGSGEVRRVDTGIPDQDPDPRIRDPRISWWPGGSQRGPGG
jgi:hypothetical protein